MVRQWITDVLFMRGIVNVLEGEEGCCPKGR